MQINICMLMIHFLPDAMVVFIVYAITLAGLALYVLSKLARWIPTAGIYKLPLEVGGIAVLCLGMYLVGGIANEAIWKQRVLEVEQKLAVAAAASQTENVKIVQKVVKQTEFIKTRGQDILKYVDREVVKYDSQCVIPKEFVQAHNAAATAPPK